MQYPMDCLIDVSLNDNSCLTPSYHHSTHSSLKNNTQMAKMPVHKGTCILIEVWIIKAHLSSFTIMLSEIAIYAWNHFSTTSFQFYIYHTTMNVTSWPMAREYSVWNATVAALQFWTDDLEAMPAVQ